jgi:hypothetical protein
VNVVVIVFISITSTTAAAAAAAAARIATANSTIIITYHHLNFNHSARIFFCKYAMGLLQLQLIQRNFELLLLI